MSNIRKADAVDWDWIESETTRSIPVAAHYRALVELRARVAALETEQRAQDKLNQLIRWPPAASDAPQSGELVRRVAMTIGPISEGGERAGILPVGKAIAVLRQIAANARARDFHGQGVHLMTWEGVAQWLEQEAGND